MRRAIELAIRGRGLVEPNPLVGAVIVDEKLNLVGEGYHTQFGKPHAEVEAIKDAEQKKAATAGATAFVTLEPCQHTGKTPPCTRALIEAGVRRVVIGSVDPAPHTLGRGIDALKDAGIEVETGRLQSECDDLIAPFRMLQQNGRPWIHAKWAMTLDGKTAAHTGSSKWISGEESRSIVHQLRGRMDGIIVGSGTAQADDPALTVRPPGQRIPVRIVVDTIARLSLGSQLVQTANDIPVLLFCSQSAPQESIAALESRGVDVITTQVSASGVDVAEVLLELGRRNMTNVLLEGGGGLAGSFFDAGLIDELHVFIAPKLVGGQGAQSPIAGAGLPTIEDCPHIENPAIQECGSDIYINGFVRVPSWSRLM
ncbi:UNVERIFIED_CONTAM: hypothetical protein GTU68_044012 [Idotea baltica]|nr:hypothetical protein [Idotea baltica]